MAPCVLLVLSQSIAVKSNASCMLKPAVWCSVMLHTSPPVHLSLQPSRLNTPADKALLCQRANNICSSSLQPPVARRLTIKALTIWPMRQAEKGELLEQLAAQQDAHTDVMVAIIRTNNQVCPAQKMRLRLGP